MSYLHDVDTEKRMATLKRLKMDSEKLWAEYRRAGIDWVEETFEALEEALAAKWEEGQ